MRRRLLLLLSIVSLVGIHAQRIVTWNVENLFDVQHDTLKNDVDFLPEGLYHWTKGRYWNKLDNVSRTLAAIAEDAGWPMLVGMCEVENDTVLRDLTRRSPLRMAKYQYIHHEGPDQRGVDVALLYQPSLFDVEGSCPIRVPSEENGLRPTRDILHVWGRVLASDSLPLHVFVVHFPSRAGGSSSSSRNRMLAAETLCASLDSLRGQHVVVMGDFNAEPGDPIFRPIRERLVSLLPQKRRELRRAQGTYYYQGLWGFIDHILVSKELLPRIAEGKAHVARLPFLLNEKGVPWRTYQGPAYKGGYSDHLPLWADLVN